MTDCEEKQRQIDTLEAKLVDLQALYDDHECVCNECEDREFDDASQPVSEWLERQKVLGLITPEGSATVQRLLEDLS